VCSTGFAKQEAANMIYSVENRKGEGGISEFDSLHFAYPVGILKLAES
jgi:hypothetical protein